MRGCALTSAIVWRQVDPWVVIQAMVQGGVSGAIAGAFEPLLPTWAEAGLGRYAETAMVEFASGRLERVVTNAISDRPLDEGLLDLREIAFDVGIGVAVQGMGDLAGGLLSRSAARQLAQPVDDLPSMRQWDDVGGDVTPGQVVPSSAERVRRALINPRGEPGALHRRLSKTMYPGGADIIDMVPDSSGRWVPPWEAGGSRALGLRSGHSAQAELASLALLQWSSMRGTGRQAVSDVTSRLLLPSGEKVHRARLNAGIEPGVPYQRPFRTTYSGDADIVEMIQDSPGHFVASSGLGQMTWEELRVIQEVARNEGLIIEVTGRLGLSDTLQRVREQADALVKQRVRERIKSQHISIEDRQWIGQITRQIQEEVAVELGLQYWGQARVNTGKSELDVMIRKPGMRVWNDLVLGPEKQVSLSGGEEKVASAFVMYSPDVSEAWVERMRYEFREYEKLDISAESEEMLMARLRVEEVDRYNHYQRWVTKQPFGIRVYPDGRIETFWGPHGP